MTLPEILNYFFGTTTVVSTFLAIRTWRASIKKENALADQEAANSVTKSQEIYNTLTAIMDRELEKLENKLKAQDILLDTQQKEIMQLRTEVKNYQAKCAICINNK